MLEIELIPENHPALNTPQADGGYDRPLQHGLCYAPDGSVVIRREIVEKLDANRLNRCVELVQDGRLSEANSLIACRNMRRPLSACPDNHEVDAPPVVCEKPLLHEACATPSARVAKFQADHPELYKHLLQSKFSVITFTCDATITPAGSLRHIFRLIDDWRSKFFLEGDHGWYRNAAFAPGFSRAETRMLHAGDKLPPQPTMERWWKSIAGTNASLRVKTYDGQDGDSQEVGLRDAFGGFVHYWTTIHAAKDKSELEISEDLKGVPLSMPFGAFRGFASAVTQDRDTMAVELPTCSQCGKRHVSMTHLPIMLPEELGGRFDHILLCHYGRKLGTGYRVPPTAAPVAPSPPS